MLDRGNPAAQGGPAPQGTPAMPTPPMPAQTPMGGPPMPAQPTMSMFPQSGPRAPLIAPQLTRDITTAEQESRYEEAANSDNPRLAAWGQRNLDEIDAIKAEKRKLITVGVGDKVGRVTDEGLEELGSNPKGPTVRSGIDPISQQLRSWTTDASGNVTETTPGAVNPTTKEQYDALPMGAQYVGSDGSTKVKT